MEGILNVPMSLMSLPLMKLARTSVSLRLDMFWSSGLRGDAEDRRRLGRWVVRKWAVRGRECVEPPNIYITGMLKIEVCGTYLGKMTRDQRDHTPRRRPSPVGQKRSGTSLQGGRQLIPRNVAKRDGTMN